MENISRFSILFDPLLHSDWSQQFLSHKQNPPDKLVGDTQGYEYTADPKLSANEAQTTCVIKAKLF